MGTSERTRSGRFQRPESPSPRPRLADILAPINSRLGAPCAELSFDDFIQQIYLPFYTRKWKRSTTMTNVDRIRNHLMAEFSGRALDSFDREMLQSFLDRKATAGLSHSVVAHLRWDLKQIFRMAVSEGYIVRNPAGLLFVPRNAHQPDNLPLYIFIG